MLNTSFFQNLVFIFKIYSYQFGIEYAVDNALHELRFPDMDDPVTLDLAPMYSSIDWDTLTTVNMPIEGPDGKRN